MLENSNNSCILVLSLIIVFIIIGNFIDYDFLWYVIDTYNIVIAIIFAEIFATKKIVIKNYMAVSALLVMCALSIIIGFIVNSSNFWSFLDVFTIIVAAFAITNIITSPKETTN